MPKTKLKQLEVNEVSLVDAGANQHAHVMLFKNRSGEPGAVPPKQEEKPQSGLRRFFSAIGKALSMPDEDVEEAVASIEKAETFGEQMQTRKLDRIADEIWDMCAALECSLCSIIRDDTVVDKTDLLNRSIDEFTETVKGMTSVWGTGNTMRLTKKAEIPAEHLKEISERLQKMLSGREDAELVSKADDADQEADSEEQEEADGADVTDGPDEDTEESQETSHGTGSGTGTEAKAKEETQKRIGSRNLELPG